MMQCTMQKKELDKFVCQAQEMKDLKERWNLLDFKYQLLLDMVSSLNLLVNELTLLCVDLFWWKQFVNIFDSYRTISVW